MRSRALANQERHQQSQRMSKFARSLLLFSATVLSFSALTLLVADQLYRPQAFVIDHLQVKGKFRYFDPSQVEQAIDQESLGNFFSVNLDLIKQNIESLAWVQNADVRREWPNTLSINITEHRPLMPFKNVHSNSDSKSKNYWLTSLGDVVDLPIDFELQNPIVLSGNERDSQLMLQQTYQWKKLIESYGIHLIKLELSDSHAWQLRLSYMNHEFDLLLGRVEVEQRLSRFLSLFDSQFKLSNQQLIRVDARYPNGLAIKSEPLADDENVAAVTINKTNLTSEQTTR